MRTMIKRHLMILLTLVMVLAFSIPTFAAPKLSKKKLKMSAGQTYSLKLKGNSKKVKWSTSKKSIVSISKKTKTSVLLKAKKVGSATVTAKIGKKSYNCKVTVSPALNISSIKLYEGKSTTLKVIGSTGKTSAKSSNTKVATVKKNSNSSYTIKAIKQGTATITITANKKSLKCKVEVLTADKAPTTPTNPSGGSSGGSSGGTSGGNSGGNTGGNTGSNTGGETSGGNTGGGTTTPTTPTGVVYKMENVPDTITLAYNEGEKTFGECYCLVNGSPAMGAGASITLNGSIPIALSAYVKTVGVKSVFCIKGTPNPVGTDYTFTLPQTYTATVKYKDYTKTVNIVVTDWGTPDKVLIENWENEIMRECGWNNPNYSNLTKLTNVCKYIATHYPYIHSGDHYINYCSGYLEKHYGGSYEVGGSCNTSTETICYFAEKLGVDAEWYYLDDSNHYVAKANIDGKDYFFECGLYGSAPRDWNVTCGDHSGAAALGYAKSGEGAYTAGWDVVLKRRFGRVDGYDIRRLDLYTELNMPSAFGLEDVGSSQTLMSAELQEELEEANVLGAAEVPEETPTDEVLGASSNDEDVLEASSNDEDVLDITDLIVEAEETPVLEAEAEGEGAPTPTDEVAPTPTDEGAPTPEEPEEVNWVDEAIYEDISEEDIMIEADEAFEASIG